MFENKSKKTYRQTDKQKRKRTHTRTPRHPQTTHPTPTDRHTHTQKKINFRHLFFTAHYSNHVQTAGETAFTLKNSKLCLSIM